VVPLVVTVLLLRLLLTSWETGTTALRAGLVLVLGGAAGNLVDRAVDGAVIDFVRFRAGSHVLFTNNLADDFISVGAVLLAIGASRLGPRPAPPAPVAG
jgi:signal peptidase II